MREEVEFILKEITDYTVDATEKAIKIYRSKGIGAADVSEIQNFILDLKLLRQRAYSISCAEEINKADIDDLRGVFFLVKKEFDLKIESLSRKHTNGEV